MGNLLQLTGNRRIDGWMVVPMQIRPDGGIGVEVSFAMDIAQHRTLAGPDDNRLVLEPIPHLRKRVPDKFLIELRDLIHAGILKRQ